MRLICIVRSKNVIPDALNLPGNYRKLSRGSKDGNFLGYMSALVPLSGPINVSAASETTFDVRRGLPSRGDGVSMKESWN